VLARIPIRNNFDTRYFNDKYQALPKYGYTEFVKNMLKHDNIEVILNMSFDEFKNNNDINKFKGIIYTGAIDHYFSSLHGNLEYRSIDFKIQKFYNIGYYQPNSVVNYPETKYDFTRIIEYKHFLHQKSDHTIIISETTNDDGEPYYPVLNNKNVELYKKYQEQALIEEQNKNVYFVGRLANYKYFNMDETIKNALEYYKIIKNNLFE